MHAFQRRRNSNLDRSTKEAALFIKPPKPIVNLRERITITLRAMNFILNANRCNKVESLLPWASLSPLFFPTEKDLRSYDTYYFGFNVQYIRRSTYYNYLADVSNLVATTMWRSSVCSGASLWSTMGFKSKWEWRERERERDYIG